MTPDPTATLTLTAADLADLRVAIRAHRRTLTECQGEAPALLAARLAVLAPRLTDALDTLEPGPV